MLLQSSSEDEDHPVPSSRKTMPLNKEIQLKAKISELEKENQKFKRDYAVALETIKRLRVYSNFLIVLL